MEKSLLGVVARQGSEPAAASPRFGMLETIREFGLDQLAASGKMAAVHRRHADYALALTKAVEPLLRGPDQVAWLERLETELPNLGAELA